LNPNISGLFDP